VPFGVGDDFTGSTTRPRGLSNDIGAFESQ
jgi:hypothetical protein